MRITDVDVIVCSPGRNYVTLRITTDGGLVGLGDATLNGRELAVQSYLADHVAPLLVGRDARRIEDTWQMLYKGAYWRRGPVTMTAIGAVDTALWDLNARALGVPLHRLLGGASRDHVLAYAHAFGTSIDAAVAAAQQRVAEGFRAVRVQCAPPGQINPYGVAAGGGAYEPAQPGAPTVETFATEPYLRHTPKALAAAREAIGPDVHLLHDVHHRLTPIEAARLAKTVEPLGLFWLEDPVPGELQRSLAVIRQHATTPIAIGEVMSSVFDCLELVERELVDHLRLSVTHGGGISSLRKIAAVAEPHHIRLSCHGPSDVSPVGFAANLHLGLALHNFGVQEHMGHPAAAREVFASSYRLDHGTLHPGDAPGLGVTFDEEAARRFPYRRAYLPIARLPDGTAHSW